MTISLSRASAAGQVEMVLHAIDLHALRGRLESSGSHLCPLHQVTLDILCKKLMVVIELITQVVNIPALRAVYLLSIKQ